MLKKKINGAWQNCYSLQCKYSGSWININYQRTFSRYTDGAWVKILFPEISIIGYSFGTSGGTNYVYSGSSTYYDTFGVFDSNYYGSSIRYTKGYFGTFPVVSGDVISGSLSYENTSSAYGSTYVIVRLVNFSSASSTTNTTIYTIIANGSATQSGYTFNYTFSRAYDNIGFYIETRASAGSGSVASRANAHVEFYLNNILFKSQRQKIYNE